MGLAEEVAPKLQGQQRQPQGVCESAFLKGCSAVPGAGVQVARLPLLCVRDTTEPLGWGWPAVGGDRGQGRGEEGKWPPGFTRVPVYLLRGSARGGVWAPQTPVAHLARSELAPLFPLQRAQVWRWGQLPQCPGDGSGSQAVCTPLPCPGPRLHGWCGLHPWSHCSLGRRAGPSSTDWDWVWKAEAQGSSVAGGPGLLGPETQGS